MKKLLVTALVGVLLVSLTPTAFASPGVVPFMTRTAVPGVAAVSIDPVDYVQTHPLVPGQFDNEHYARYDEVVSLLKMWATKYPELTQVYTVGESFEGRDIWQITITAKSTGSAESKPAMWVGANRHAGEVTARVAALDFINTLLTGYGKDPEITNLVNTRTFYVKPMENPDGAELYLSTAQTLRSTVRPNDDDRDGASDEDPGEDLNGDGYITQMRQYVGPGKGTYRQDPKDPRIMVRDRTGKGDWITYSEGIDSDKDGKINEDGIGGLDLHRNYPENWRPMQEATGYGYTQGGAGEYPLSEPEIRSNYLFLITHPNVSIAQTMDTSVPMHLRPPSTSHPEESMFPLDNAYYDHFDAEGKTLSGYSMAGDVFHEYSDGDDQPLFGHSPDFGYFQLGAIWYGDELWGATDCMKGVDYDGDNKFTNYDAIYMNDKVPQYKGKIFVDWTPYDHPTLGKVEIGGWNPKFWNQNPPAGPILAKTVARETAFNMMLAKDLPLVKVSNPVVMRNADGTHTLSVTVANEGFLPDALKQAYLVKIVRPDTASIKLGAGMSLTKGGVSQTIGLMAGALEDNDTTFQALSNMTWARTRQVTWVIKGSGTVDVTVRSTRGGTSTLQVQIP